MVAMVSDGNLFHSEFSSILHNFFDCSTSIRKYTMDMKVRILVVYDVCHPRLDMDKIFIIWILFIDGYFSSQKNLH
jgi:hypothetical protein